MAGVICSDEPTFSFFAHCCGLTARSFNVLIRIVFFTQQAAGRQVHYLVMTKQHSKVRNQLVGHLAAKRQTFPSGV